MTAVIHDILDTIDWFFPVINFALLVGVLRQLVRARVAPTVAATSTCLRTGADECVVLERPDLLCAACRERINAAVREARQRIAADAERP